MTWTVRDFRFTDYKLIQEFIPHWKTRRFNYDIDYLNIEKMLKCILFFNDDKLAMLSGIDDLHQVIPDTYRILTKATTTKYKPICWGPYIEDKFFSNVMAGISVEFCLKEHKNIVITTNKNSRISNVVLNNKRRWLKYRCVKKIFNVDQIIWDIDIDECIKLTDIWKEKLCMDF
jgi:hypothetical protein